MPMNFDWWAIYSTKIQVHRVQNVLILIGNALDQHESRYVVCENECIFAPEMSSYLH